MTKLRNAVGAFVIMFVLIVLLVNSWEGFQVGYNVQEQNLQGGKTVLQKLQGINMIAGINKITIAIQDLGNINNPLDLVGAIATGGLGTAQVIGGVVTFPLEIFGVITGFYDNIIPPILPQLLGFLATITVGFIILSAKLGWEF